MTSVRQTAPHSPDVEAALVGALIGCPAAIRGALRIVAPQDLYVPRYRRILEVLADMNLRSEAVNPTTIAAHLPALNGTGKTEITRLMADCPALSAWPDYARIVVGFSRERQQLAAAHELVRAIRTGDPAIAAVARDEMRRVIDNAVGAGELPAQPLDQFLALEFPEEAAVVARFAEEGDNVLLAAQYKAGKTTWGINFVRALVQGTPFLGTFGVSRPRRVTWVNAVMAERRSHRWYRDVGIEPGARERLQVVNLRGRRRFQRITDAAVRGAWIRTLAEHQADDVLVDCLRPIASACGFDENSNSEMSELLAWLDEIKAEAGISVLAVLHHSGRSAVEEGDEHGRGASALDDWPDVRILLTKVKGGQRFVRTEGRMDDDLAESRLDYEPVSRILTLAGEGESRAAARIRAAQDVAVRAVDLEPGINKRGLREAVTADGIRDHADRDRAIAEAIRKGLIHHHPGKRNEQLHYRGRPHTDVSQLCPWRPTKERPDDRLC